MAKGSARLAASKKAVDPTLDALFSSSFGPVKAPAKSRYSELAESKPKNAPKVTAEQDNDQEDDEVLSEISEELSYSEHEEEDDNEGSESSDNESDAPDDEDAASGTKGGKEPEADEVTPLVKDGQPKRERKRKRKDEHDDLEDRYLSKLVDDDDDTEPAEKRQKDGTSSDDEDDNQDDAIPVHETLATSDKTSDLEKAARTVFLANVSTEAISSKAAKKTLMAHLSSVLDKDASPAEKIESIRFRSVAFATGSMPKRAAYINKALMQETTKSANAYVVYSTTSAARTAASKLNGTEVLGRHIRVDNVAHPSPTAHRRCVFVGNLGFVDDETVLNTDKDGVTTQKKRGKVPADIEEGLWRTFSAQGRRVENVRVVRDSKTRVGKGFAYVQFYDANDVESALLLDGKKFPPMLPRALRVTRAKDPRKTALAQERAKAKTDNANGATRSMKHTPKATPEQQSMIGRTGKLLGQAAAFQQRLGNKRARREPREPRAPREGRSEIRTPEQIVLEGKRATQRDALPKDLKGKKLKSKGKPQHRSARRAAAWKKKT